MLDHNYILDWSKEHKAEIIDKYHKKLQKEFKIKDYVSFVSEDEQEYVQDKILDYFFDVLEEVYDEAYSEGKTDGYDWGMAQATENFERRGDPRY